MSRIFPWHQPLAFRFKKALIYLAGLIILLDMVGVIATTYTFKAEWQNRKTNGLPSGTLIEVKTLIGDGKQLYAGTDKDGIFHSNDGGLNWFPANKGLSGFSIEL